MGTLRHGGDIQTLPAVIKKIEFFAHTGDWDAKTSSSVPLAPIAPSHTSHLVKLIIFFVGGEDGLSKSEAVVLTFCLTVLGAIVIAATLFLVLRQPKVSCVRVTFFSS